jgi:hypothetical protein
MPARPYPGGRLDGPQDPVSPLIASLSLVTRPVSVYVVLQFRSAGRHVHATQRRMDVPAHSMAHAPTVGVWVWLVSPEV